MICTLYASQVSSAKESRFSVFGNAEGIIEATADSSFAASQFRCFSSHQFGCKLLCKDGACVNAITQGNQVNCAGVGCRYLQELISGYVLIFINKINIYIILTQFIKHSNKSASYSNS